MSATDSSQIEENPGHKGCPTNPSDNYPPTRPGKVVVILALGLIAIGLGIENWRDLSALTHFAQIEKTLGL